MQKLKNVLLRICTLLFFTQGIFGAPLVFDSQSSTFKVDSGATLTFTNPVPNYNGTLQNFPGGTLAGSLVSFTDGILEDSGNFDIRLTALFNPTGAITLPGNSQLLAESGKIIDSVTVSSVNNQLRGQPQFSGPVTLTDASTTLTIALQSTMNQNIVMNGGTLALENDLTFIDTKKPTGTGTFNGGGHAIILGGVPTTYTDSFLFLPNTNLSFYNCQADLSATWTFQGPNYINGQGNVLDLRSGGQIFVQTGTLELQDINVKGITQNSFLFGSPSAAINMCSANLEFLTPVNYTQGNFLVDSISNWVIKDNNVTFAPGSNLTVAGSTLWIDRAGAATIGSISGSTTMVDTGTIKEACVTPCGSTIDLSPLITSTGFLQSQIDTCCNALRTSTGFLQSEIDVLGSCCDELRTSTGFLQSQIDFILSQLICCGLEFFYTTTVSNDVLSTDWSATFTQNNGTTFIAAGMNNTLLGDPNVLKLYKFTGNSLVQTDQTAFGTYAPVSSVRFHPTSPILAVARRSDVTGLTYSGSLSTYLVDPNTGLFGAAVSTVEVGNDVRAITWDPTGNFLAITSFQPIIIGTIILLGNHVIEVYAVNQVTGALTLTSAVATIAGSLPISSATGPNIGALDWNKAGDFISVGLTPLPLGPVIGDSVAVYQFINASTPLSLDVSAPVPVFPGVGLGASPVTAINWNDNKPTTLALGLQVTGTVPNQPIQVWEHSTGTLTYKSGASSSVANVVINDLDFSPDGKCLAAARTAIAGGPTASYSFNQSTDTLTLVTEFGGTATGAANTIRWDHTNGFVVDGTALFTMGGITAPGEVQLFEAACLAGGGGSSCDCAAIESRLDILETCCAQLRTSTGFLQSEIDVLDDCCDDLRTSTGFLQSELDNCCAALKTSTGFLQSQIDILGSCCTALKTSTGFLQSEIDVLDDCCTDLRTSTGFLQSEIDVCCNSLTSRVEVLETCCDALRTSTGFLQSEIDTANCCAALMTSTGFLQSQIDSILCPVNCCDVHPVTDASVDNIIQTVDWSFDSRFVAIGLSNNQPNGGPASDQQVLKVYELVGSSLVLRAQTILGTIFGEVTDVRWHPTMYRLAVSRQFINLTSPENRLHIIDFDPLFNTLTQTSEAEPVDVYAVAWLKVPMSNGNDLLAVGRNDATGDNIALHSVTPLGLLSAPLWTEQPGSDVSLRALDWDATNQYLAAGITAGPGHDSLQVYQVDTTNPFAPTLTFITSTDVTLSSGTPTANAVNWNPVYNNILAVGYAVDSPTIPSDQLVQTFDFNGATLTQTSGITGLDLTIRGAHWHPDGLCLAIGKDGQPTSDFEFAIYGFNNATSSLAGTPSSEFSTTGSATVEDVRWAPDGHSIATGDDNGTLSVYQNNCPQVTICELISRVEALETCCESLRTSTGFLQSEIDFVRSLTFVEACFAVCSRIEQLESCCEALRTSTGLLQSQIDLLADCCQDECADACDVNFLVKNNDFTDDVATADWSFDNRFIAIGLSNDNALNDTNVLKIYELVDSTLVLRAQTSFTNLRDVAVVRWHPTLYRLAVGRIVAIDNVGEPQLHIFDFDPNTYALTVQGTAEIDKDVYALSWRPSPLDAFDDVLAVGRKRLQQIGLYTVNIASGAITPLVIGINPATATTGGGDIQLQAMDWDRTSNYLAVGVQCDSPQQALQVFQFHTDGIPVPLTLQASTNVSTLVDGLPVNHTVLAVDWNKDTETQNLIAVGLNVVECLSEPSVPAPGELVQVFSFDNGAGTLTHSCGIEGFDSSVPSVQWHKDGNCLVVGQDTSADCPEGHGGQFITYGFDRFGCIFTQSKLFNDFGCADVGTVRWAPNGRLVVAGNDTEDGQVPGGMTVYDNDCLTFRELVSIVEILETCCEELRTSTGFLQSQVDICCTQVDDCCTALQTSTGFLQSQLDECCGTRPGPFECVITVTGCLELLPSMLPQDCGTAVVFEFSPCYGCMFPTANSESFIPNPDMPRVIIDPANFPGGQVILPACTRLIFRGEGVVTANNGISFQFQGTTGGDKTDWPALIVEENAIMNFAFAASCPETIECPPPAQTVDLTQTATIVFGGQAGGFIVRGGAKMLLDVPVNVIFGDNPNTQIEFLVDDAGAVVLNHGFALLSFVYNVNGGFDIIFNNHSVLDIILGTMEFNTLNGKSIDSFGNPVAGLISKFNFLDGASIRISKIGRPDDGLLRLSPNFLNATTQFDNRAGVTFVGNVQTQGGNIQFVNDFDVNGNPNLITTLVIEDKHLAFNSTMLDIFMELTYVLDRGVIASPDSIILALLGSFDGHGNYDPTLDGKLAGYCFARDGSVVQIPQNAHDVRYANDKISGWVINQVGQKEPFFICCGPFNTAISVANADVPCP